MSAVLTRLFPAGPLALFRGMVGLAGVALALNTGTNLLRIARPESLRLPTASWLPAVTTSSVWMLTGAWLAAAVALGVGYRSRAAAVACAACSFGAAVWDIQTLSNHQTLFMALCLLLALSQCGAALSIDSRRGARRDHVPYWPVFLLQLQVTSMYAFTAVAKLTPSFVRGEVLREGIPLAGWIAAQGSPVDLIPVMAIGTIVVESFLAIGLWFRPTRLAAVVAGVGLHLSILISTPGLTNELAPFALLSMATYVLFLGLDVDLPHPQREISVESAP